MTTIRKLLRWLPIAVGVLAFIAVFEWVEYEVRGAHRLFGINPRCTKVLFDSCHAVDTTNLPWSATIAVWLAHIGWWTFVVAMVVFAAWLLIAVAFLIVDVVRDPNPDLLGRLADSRRWLGTGTMGAVWLITAMVAVPLLWAGWWIPGILLAGGVLSSFASMRAEEWAGRYRHNRFLQQQAESQQGEGL